MRAGQKAENINGASFGSPLRSVVPDSVLNSVKTAALHQGTLISFRRLLLVHSLGRLAWKNPNPERAMSRKRKSNKKTGAPVVLCLDPNAAGVDIGATEIYIAVPEDRDPQPVRCFPTFTEDLHAAADWLKTCHIETVAMESTGVYWIPFFDYPVPRIVKEIQSSAKSRVIDIPSLKPWITNR